MFGYSANRAQELQAITRDLSEVGNNIFYLDEFIAISSIINDLSDKMQNNINQEFPDFLINILKDLLEDMEKWLNSVFIEQDSANIHEFDASIISAAKQLMMFMQSSE